MRQRRPRGQRKTTCSKCDNPPRKKGRYCEAHHAEYMRAFRLKKKQENQNKNV